MPSTVENLVVLIRVCGNTFAVKRVAMVSGKRVVQRIESRLLRSAERGGEERSSQPLDQRAAFALLRDE